MPIVIKEYADQNLQLLTNKIEKHFDDHSKYYATASLTRQPSFTKPSSVKPLLSETQFVIKVNTKLE